MTSTLPKPLFANRNRRASIDECSKSFPSKPSGSRNAVLASSNETPCFSWLCLAFLESHSNINYVYTKYFPAARWYLVDMGLGRDTDHPAPPAHQCSIVIVIEVRHNTLINSSDLYTFLALLPILLGTLLSKLNYFCLVGATVPGLAYGKEGIGRWTKGSKQGTGFLGLPPTKG